MATLGTVLAVLIGAVFLAVPLLSRPLSRFVPASVQESFGSRMMSDLAITTSFCRSEDGLAALDKLAEELAVANGSPRPFRVTVADDDLLNAFAAPGGYIVLFRSVIEQAESPNEVAGVLAHEMSHVSEGHTARGLVEALGYGAFGLFSDDESMSAELVQSVVGGKYSRDDELEADLAGVHMLNRAGIGSKGLNTFFDRLSAMEGDVPGLLEFLSTHPTGDKRKAALREHTRDGRPALSADEWKALQNICAETGPVTYVRK